MPNNDTHNPPPRFVDRFLEWFCAPELREEVLGDLHERYHRNVRRLGAVRARRRYWQDGLSYLRPFVLKRKTRSYPNPLPFAMLTNYLTVAVRTFLRSKGYSALTLLSLALGLTVSLLILLYVADEASYDRHHRHANRIYRINGEISFTLNWHKTPNAPTPMGATLKRDLPEVEDAVRLGTAGSMLVKSGGENVREEKVLYADSTVFNVFTLPVLAGNPQKALASPGSVVITESTALRYFRTRNALNRTLVFNNGEMRRVTAVIRDIPAQSHFRADFLLPLHETEGARVNKWGNHMFKTYVLLRPGTDPRAVEAKFEQILQTYMDPALRQFFNTTLAETRKAGNGFRYSLMPLADIHLHSDQTDELSPGGNIGYVYLFAGIAGLILLIAVFNFVNLATARSATRAREIGVRKVLGSGRGSLVSQFLAESLLYTLLASAVAVGGVSLLLPLFNQLAAKTLPLSRLLDGPFVLALLAGTVGVGLLAGLYPALYLSSFRASSVVKGKAGAVPGRGGLRSTLVVFQFSLSILLIVGTLLIHRQLRYLQTRQLGFDKEQVVTVRTSQASQNQALVFKAEASRQRGVQVGTVSGFLPVPSRRGRDNWYPEGTADDKYAVPIQEWKVDPDYVATLGLGLRQGRNFSPGRAADAKAAIINESAAKRLGYADPVGKIIHNGDNSEVGKLQIIGVVKDFHFESLHREVGPVMLHQDTALAQSWEAVSFRLAPGDVPGTLAALEKQWKRTAPGLPFEYAFLDASFDALYRSEQRTGQLFTAFAAVAILIACLGLFGLSAFTAEQRTKEIGIRKVFGASVPQLVRLLSKDFLRLVLLANVLAGPVAWWAGRQWLENYAFRTVLGPGVFGLAAAVSVGIALLTVGFQALKAALANPVESLRNE
jgi:putative ABC transport system permease protein